MAKSIVRFESRTIIQAPVSDVFERLADLPGYRRWMHRTGLFRGCSLTSEPPVRRGDDLRRFDPDGHLEREVRTESSPTPRESPSGKPSAGPAPR